MLFFFLAASLILLVIVNVIVWWAKPAGAVIGWLRAALLFWAFYVMWISPAYAIQTVLLCAATVPWRGVHRGPAYFLRLTCGATLAAYGFAGLIALKFECRYARLRTLYPYESMEDRVPVPKAVPGGVTLLPAAAKNLSDLRLHNNWYRNDQLESLHEHAVALFINSPGFGYVRMSSPSARSLSEDSPRRPIPPQPRARLATNWSPGDLMRLPAYEEATLNVLLQGSIADFVYSQGFGYIKDRQHVAGFESHRFAEIPESGNRWKVQTLDLVSLLLHDPPEVYVSSHLPQMDRLHGAPTRLLDRFEGIGLDVLRKGEDIFTTQDGDGLRMVGAIRSASECVACHGGERGALLGAFSYVLRSDRH